MRHIISLVALGLVAFGCGEAGSPVAPDMPASAPLFSSAATITEGEFFATAMCAADIGYNIRFGGPRVLVRHVSGNDETFSFRTQQFEGWIMDGQAFTSETVDFKVLGGAEMFNIKRNDDGSFHVRIHQGTLTFEALDGSYRVLARHTIRLNPGQGEMANEWRCRVIG